MSGRCLRGRSDLRPRTGYLGQCYKCSTLTANASAIAQLSSSSQHILKSPALEERGITRKIMNNPMRSHGSRVVRVVCCTLLLMVAVANCLAETDAAATAGKAASLKVPLSFEQNQGQADQAIRFMARTGHYRLFLTNHGTVLKVAGQKGLDAVLRTTLVGANPVSEIEGIDKRTWTTNYIVGSQSDWKSAVPNFARVKYTAVYPGVDLIYHGEQQQLE